MTADFMLKFTANFDALRKYWDTPSINNLPFPDGIHDKCYNHGRQTHTEFS
jgi:hypothetical protein